MSYIEILFKYAFEFLNLTLKIPLNTDNTQFLEFPLYMVFIVLFIIGILQAIWTGIIINSKDITGG